ncbi:hypothetical protein PC116_g19798 [Phytophthora cactorum]|nr:hypothetical protein PC116_g19798 [Phytophthora cactorum]
MRKTPTPTAGSAVAPTPLVAAQASLTAYAAPFTSADTSAPISEVSIRQLLSGTLEASANSFMTQLLPYLVSTVRHQFQLSIAPPLHNDLVTRRRLDRAVGFDAILAVIQPLHDAHDDLPRVSTELQAKLHSAEAEAASARRAAAPVIMVKENLEQYLKTANSPVEPYQFKSATT